MLAIFIPTSRRAAQRLAGGIVCAAWCTAMASADIPRKAPVLKYKSLWENSPFTTKPTPAAAPEAAPLEEYSLIGIAPISGGYCVTLVSKSKDAPEKRTQVYSNESNASHGFTIERVEIDRDQPLNSKVHLNTPTGPGTVVFDQAALAARAPQPPPARQMNAQAQPVGITGGVRPPRPRIAPNAQPGQAPQGGGRFNRQQNQGQNPRQRQPRQ